MKSFTIWYSVVACLKPKLFLVRLLNMAEDLVHQLIIS